MTNSIFSTRWVRLFLAAFSMAILFTGCGDSDREREQEKEKTEESDKKPAYERVAILKDRFDQLENSLDELERDLDLQKDRINHTRKTMQSIKRSLIRGNLKGYSIDTVTSDPQLMQVIEKHKEKKAAEKEKAERKEKSENKFFSWLLILLILAFLVAVIVVALRERTQDSPYDISPPPYTPPVDPASTNAAPEETDVDSGSGYQELGRREDTENRPPNEGPQQ